MYTNEGGYSGNPDQFLSSGLTSPSSLERLFSIVLLLQELLLANRPAEVCAGRAKKKKREIKYIKREVKPNRTITGQSHKNGFKTKS